MSEMDLTTYCGLYCGDCIRYRAEFSDLADNLLKEFERVRFSEYAKVYGVEHYDDAISFLKMISLLKCEKPCRLGQEGTKRKCEVKQCVKAKGYEGCWQCDDFEKCGKLDFLKPFCGKAPINNLRKIKEVGIDNWAKFREKQYPWL